MNRISKVELADAIALYAHQGQKDKGGNDYILHPRAVAAQMKTKEEKTVALLHDIVEDTFVTKETLENLFGKEISEAVSTMSHKPQETYEEYIKKVARNHLARRVKIADLNHNMDLSRLPYISEKDLKRVEKYKKAMEYLQSFDL